MRFALARRPSPAIMAFVSLAALAGCARDEGPGPTAPVFEDARQSLGAASLACESASDIRAVIDGLAADGTLNAGRAQALRTKVDQAEAHEAAGRFEEAAEAYARLIEQVEEWVADGSLSESDVVDLLACVEDVLNPDPSILFVSDRDGDAEIFVMDAHGGVTVQLTDNASGDGGPAWSPDRSKIAFFTDRDGNNEIYVMNADGSAPTRLTSIAATDLDPAWSPDGSKIAFVSDRDGNFEIYIMNADGTGVTRITNDLAFDGEPAWSPDGATIAFRTHRDDVDGEIYVMNADGSAPTRLTNSTGFDANPDWSPDGSQIAFSSDRAGSDFGLYVMNADGSAPMQLSNGMDAYPAWSPDGSKIAFGSDRDGNLEIYVMNADGSGPTRLTVHAANDYRPDW